MSATRGFAPAKLILFGEHAVGYGAPALGIALSRGVAVELQAGTGGLSVTLPEAGARPLSTGPSVETLVGAVLGDLCTELDVTIDFQVPPQAGLGTSAALAIALIRARNVWTKSAPPEATSALHEEAMRVEHLTHGRSSGLDPALVLHGGAGPVWFLLEGGETRIEIVPLASAVHFVVAMSRPHAGTSHAVGRIAALASTCPALHATTMSYLGALTTSARESLSLGDMPRLGLEMDLAHGVLAGLGLVSSGVTTLIERAKASGALGAKMTGAGGAGGALFALAGDREASRRIAEAWTESGAFVLEAHLL